MPTANDTVADADAPPGRWIRLRGLGFPVWEGTATWRTVHGASVMYWLLGRPYAVEGAMTDDGRMEALSDRDGASTTWRRRCPGSPDGWVTGDIRVAPDDILFVDHPFQADPTVPDLGRDMSRDPAFMARVQEDAFASALYDHLQAGPYRKGSHPREWGVHGRNAGDFVAGLRGLGEDYILFYLGFMDHGPDEGRPDTGTWLRDEIDGHLLRLGWSRVPAPGR